jgi:hypothetical protein
MTHFDNLTADSTLGDLPLHDLCVSHKTPGRVIAEHFVQDSGLPGILIEDDTGNISLISRRRFHERMSSPYGLEIFLNRPIATFLEMSQRERVIEVLVLPNTEKIDMSVRLGLGRSPDHCYDPIIVVFEDDNLPGFQVRSLLDFHTMLLAQSQIMSHTNQEIHRQKLETQRYLIKLNQQQQEVKKYANLLENQQGVIRERNRILESQQEELIYKSEEIAKLNQQFIEIGQLLSEEGQKAFQATFAGVNDICRNAEQIMTAGTSLRDELNTIGDISNSIAKVSRQVHHLSVKASIVISRSNDALSGFSSINEEIGNLVSQTFDAGKQIEQVATRFRQRIEEFTTSAQEGMTVARSLISQTEHAQIALNQLEQIVRNQVNTLKEQTDSVSREGFTKESLPQSPTAPTFGLTAETVLQLVDSDLFYTEEGKPTVVKTDGRKRNPSHTDLSLLEGAG